MVRVLAVVVIVGILISGCNSGEDLTDVGIELRQQLAKGCQFTTEIIADFGDKTYSFAMECSLSGDGSMMFTVVSPESIHGVSGKVSSAGGELTFDKTVLAFPVLAEGEISPIVAPWLFYRSLVGGYIRAGSREEVGHRLTIDDSFSGENIQMDIWLGNDNVPQYAEFLWDGHRAVQLHFDKFIFM